VFLEVLDEGIRPGIDPAHVSVVTPLHEKRRSAVLAEDLDDLAVPHPVADGVAANHETVSRLGAKTERCLAS
jgi:hypothetical protein